MAMINQTTLFDRSIQKMTSESYFGYFKWHYLVCKMFDIGQKRRQVWFLSELFSFNACDEVITLNFDTGTICKLGWL